MVMKGSKLKVWNDVTTVHVMFWGSLSNDDGDGNENGKKSNWFRIEYFLSDVFVTVAVVVA